MNIAIIGGGAGGLMAAGLLCKYVNVTIFDGNEKFGKKIYITGKGRCNLTNNCSQEEFLSNVVRGKKFMMSAISKFPPRDCIDYFEGLGLKLKTERGNRVFPVSDKASDVTKALERQLACTKKLNERVLSIKYKDVFVIRTEKSEYNFDRVIVATGGKSYSATGCSGDGYKFAKQFGHNITPLAPALVPIKLGENVKELEGLSLKNVTLYAEAEGQKVHEFGELLFTSDGITGPIVLTLSSKINRSKNVKLYLDMKPALDKRQLESRLLREFEDRNKNLSTVLKRMLPKNFVVFFMRKANLVDKKINSVTVEERNNIIKYLKEFPLEYKGLYPIDVGVVTSGGVDLNEINPSSMESKKQKGLYIIGEVLDIDCLTGGFNLQTAFSTAFACAGAIIKEVNK